MKQRTPSPTDAMTTPTQTATVHVVHPSLADLAEDLIQAGYLAPIDETHLRDFCRLPSWVGIPPLFVEMVNQAMGCAPEPTAEGGPTGDLFNDLFSGLNHVFSGNGKR